MDGYRRFSTRFLCACILSLIFAAFADAQCALGGRDVGDIGAVPGNPFHAERVTTFTGPARAFVVARERPPQLVARDSQGRVRVEAVGNKYQVKTGIEAGSEVEQHLVTICDPASQTMTQLDTLNRTARVMHVPMAIAQRAAHPREPFCAASRLPVSRIRPAEDLGHRTIEGVDAEGVRVTMQPLSALPNGETPGASVIERWCSEELAAVVLQETANSKSRSKTSTALTKLERQEPDSALFQIPADYTINELVPSNVGGIVQQGIFHTPSSPRDSTANPPSKP